MDTARDQQKASRRNDILLAAAKLFATRGYHGTSISGIAAEMGAPKSAVGYHQFSTKKSIAIAIIEQQQARWLQLVHEVNQRLGTGLEQYLTLLLSLALDARQNPLAAAALRLWFEYRTAGIDIPVSSLRWRTLGRELIQRSLDEKDIPSPRRPEDIVGFIAAASYGVFEAENMGFQPLETNDNLRTLWVDLLVALNVQDPTAVVARLEIVDF